MFGKKNVSKTFEKEISEPLPEKFPTPKIVLFDTDELVGKSLADANFLCKSATLGSIVKVPNNDHHVQHFLKLNYEYPVNLHEFDVVIVDLTSETTEAYQQEKHYNPNTREGKEYSLLCAFPQKIFDPRPLSSSILKQEILSILQKNSILLVFCRDEVHAEYTTVEVNSRTKNISNKVNASNFDLLNVNLGRSTKYGNKITLTDKNTIFDNVLGKYITQAQYGSIFHHPTKWDGRKHNKDDDFVPLLLNADKEIVGFGYYGYPGLILVLPDIKDKAGLCLELCSSYFPEITPEIFPSHGEFKWLSNPDYLLPNEEAIITRKIQLENKFKTDIASIENEISQNRIQHSFLHEMLFQTGDKLVAAVKLYLSWLGFESIKTMDESDSAILAEDLQIESPKGLLVIEIKGIGGTSTDKDCSQISKIRYRRAEERNKFDVFGLYIVNHQRYSPPESRMNPPFTENQIKDASLDKRGLITTYTLFKTYFYIESGLLTKEHARNQLFNIGLIKGEPSNLESIGKVSEVFKSGFVIILQLEGLKKLSIGSELIISKHSKFIKTKIISIKKNDKDVSEATEGEYGICLDKAVKKGSVVMTL